MQRLRKALALVHVWKVDSHAEHERCENQDDFVVVSRLRWAAAINAGRREQARVKEGRYEPRTGMMAPTA